ncbi:type II secretion system protein [Neobacillus mesonae]|uniref:type II secretion system protein n=1 Tax=Neobacillus mesonae TaxID=1193713 RepID=UPI00203EDDF5|nr:prepilin-type N-terminal cleavage/methylation domain-containing protein [Neobacillus mesonae]MCM3568386.1 type II secretion system GspH family protein [Neobacillus mesonae]
MKKLIGKLLNKKMKLLKNQQGLTLIELLVVIVILGIIAAVAIPMVSNQSSNAKKSAAEQTNAIVKDAVQRYVATDSAYTSGSKVTITNLVDKYLKETPKCPDTYNAAGNTDDLQKIDYCTAN